MIWINSAQLGSLRLTQWDLPAAAMERPYLHQPSSTRQMVKQIIRIQSNNPTERSVTHDDGAYWCLLLFCTHLPAPCLMNRLALVRCRIQSQEKRTNWSHKHKWQISWTHKQIGDTSWFYGFPIWMQRFVTDVLWCGNRWIVSLVGEGRRKRLISTSQHFPFHSLSKDVFTAVHLYV